MSIIRKIASAILIISMAISFAVYTVPADNTDVSEAVMVLTALDVLEDGFEPNNNITRSEFVMIMAKVLGVSEGGRAETGFSDVDINHPASGSISAVTKMGIISGYSDGRFGVEDPLMYEQAVKMLISALGYEMYANSKGGYPSGYLVMASEKGIIKGVNAAEGPLKADSAANLVYNALNTDIMKQVGYGVGAKYTINPGETLLTENLGIFNKTGQVTATSNTRLSSPDSNVAQGRVEINGEIYAVGETDAVDLLGFKVSYYFKKNTDTGEKELLLIFPEQGRNNTLTILADDIENFSQGSFSYNVNQSKGDITRKIIVPNTADVIFNGVALPEYSDLDLTPKTGNVRFLDVDGNGDYELVFVKSYENYVVGSVNSNENTFTDKAGKAPISLESDQDGTIFEIKMDGRTIRLQSLREGDVVSVAKSKNAELIDIVLNTQKVNGKIEQSDDTAVYINGNEYKIAESYKQAIKNNIEGFKSLEPGDAGEFRFDIDGKLAYFEYLASASGEKYGVLTGSEITRGLDQRYQFRIYTDEGKLEVMSAAKRFFIDDVQMMTEQGTSLPEKFSTMQPVRYSTNLQGEITQINTLAPHSERADLTYYNWGTFSGRFLVDESTVVFKMAPEDSKDNEQLYATGNRGYFLANTRYTVEPYEINDMGVAKLVIDHGGGAVAASGSPVAVVKRITKTIDEDGNVTEKLYGIYDALTEVELGVASDDILSNARFRNDDDIQNKFPKGVKAGDIVRYTLNAADQITGIEKILDSAMIGQGNPMSGYSNPSHTNLASSQLFVYGILRKVEGHAMRLAVGDNVNGSPMFIMVNRPNKVLLFDQKTATLSAINWNDVGNYTYDNDTTARIFVFTRGCDVRNIIIYKTSK